MPALLSANEKQYLAFALASAPTIAELKARNSKNNKTNDSTADAVGNSGSQ
ncbi:UNVERIFIED_CONTAM: hypothetical protein HDU68_002816 [Siphonaria sp. JEL0065]|nr:hypothetical protein HDU68_002816 [Siphonaria sp. JEL0065]